MMNGFGMGGGWIVMLVIWAGLIGVIAFAITRLVGGTSTPGGDRAASPADTSPREILDRRLARGEIDPDTYTAVADRLAHGERR